MNEHTADLSSGQAPASDHAWESTREPVDAPAVAASDTEGSSAENVSQPSDRDTAHASTATWAHKDSRSETRIHVGWHADAFIDGHGVERCFLKEISSQGTDIFLDHNLRNVKVIKLHIYVPPLGAQNKPHVMEVSGKIIYTAYDSDESLFRAGVNFVSFTLESDREYLQSCTANA
ncbi:MAG: hypothetical protein HY016_01020 [Nitrosomonadales bacterium]|nr:hypothetical protein [Nitrosomonadales bacterium]